MNTFIIFLYLAITILYFSTNYFTGVGINEAVLFTVESGLSGAGFGEYMLLIAVVLLCFVTIFALSYLYFRIVNNSIHPKPKRLKGAIHNAFLLLAFLSHPFVLDLYSILDARYTKQSTDFDQYYKKPDITTQKTNGMNIVYIYAESLENTYFDESIFPGLMNNLKELKKESTEFTNINQVPGTGWTIAGMTASQCSIPLFTVSGENSILQTVADENAIDRSSRDHTNRIFTRNAGENSMGNMDTFLSGTECLGDILKKLDYHLIYIQGASTTFSGKDKFYNTHKFDEIYGHEELTSFLKDKSYVNGWGLYDDSTLDIAFEKYEKLSQDNKKFALFTLTLDTHHPNGHPSKTCKDIPYEKGENSILNAVHCSDYLISKFIRKIQNSKYADKTLIVLTSDHLAMRNTAIDLLLKGKRRDLFLIFEPKLKKYTPVNKKGSMFDVAPTILSMLGIDTDLGLGRNLLVKDSLYSSFKNFNKKLLSWRDGILSLWQFPKLPEYYDINISEKKVYIAGNSYKFPVLFIIKKNRELQPIFQSDAPKKLYMYFPEFGPTQKFIWVDNCKKQKIMLDVNTTGKTCVVQGSLSTKLEVKSLRNELTKINTTQLFNYEIFDLALYQKRLKRPNRLRIAANGIRPYGGQVWIRSSSFSTLSKLPSIIRTPNKKLPLLRGLNILTADKHGEFFSQQFDVYGSQEAANEFLKTIELLIKQKKFWVVMAHDAINNTYPGYKEELIRLGFKLLPTLNQRVAYIAYQDEDGNMHEYSDKDTISKMILSFIKD